MGTVPQAVTENFNMGFGWSFYGFFIVAALAVVAYFLWARFVNSRSD